MIRVEQERPAGRKVDFDAATADHTDGCGQPPPGSRTGRVCAGTGSVPSCQLCPYSPTYHRDRTRRAHTLRAAMTGPDVVTAPAPFVEVEPDDAEAEGRLL